MKEQKCCAGNLMPARIGLIGLATVIGLALTLTVVIAQTLNFGFSYMTGPQYARPNDVITYTVVAVNAGNILERNVILSDVLPSGTLFITDSCTYDYGYGDQPQCGPPSQMWEMDFFPGTRITTTFAATVTADTPHWPLVNHAYLSWSTGQKEMVLTTTVLSAIPLFDLSYQPKPPNADTGGLITYTIVAVNTGDSVSGVIFSDTLPGGVEFVPGSCFLDVKPSPGTGSLRFDCIDNDLVPGKRGALWLQDMPHGSRITTTFLVSVTVPEGSARWPLVNCAYLGWDVIEEEACYTSLANPTVYIHLPLVLRNYWFDPYEPNDTPLQAYGPLVSGQVYRAYIWDIMDKDDYYHFTPITNTEVTIELTNIPPGTDYDLYVYYYDGEAYQQVAKSERYDNADENVAFIPEAGEKHYIRIYQREGFSREQPYHLVATYQ